MKTKLTLIAVMVTFLFLLTWVTLTTAKPLGTNFIDAVNINCTDCATATPALLVNQASGTGGGKVFQFGTLLTPLAEGYRTGGVRIYAPTAQPTNVPGLVVDCANVGNCLELRRNGTPSAQFNSSGQQTGAFVLAQQSATVTATFVITPTAPYIVMTSNAAYTSSTSTPIITTTATAGQILILRNGNASDALVIDGTGGTVECKADVSLGASDTLTLIYNGSKWNCVAGYDNS